MVRSRRDWRPLECQNIGCYSECPSKERQPVDQLLIPSGISHGITSAITQDGKGKTRPPEDGLISQTERTTLVDNLGSRHGL